MLAAKCRRPAVALAAILIACTPASPGGVQREPGEAQRSPRTLVVIASEPETLSRPMNPSGPYPLLLRLVNAGLGIRDAAETPRPYLADTLPELNTDTWRVFADGRMETVYRLKPNLSWHDGTPLNAEDFVFGWQVYVTPELGVGSAQPQNQIEAVLAPDPQTVLVKWRRIYADAGILAEDFTPLPRHLVGPAYQQGSPEAFLNQAYWTREYIGLGPYRLERWEPGTFIEAVAFDGHALGRARIDRVRIIPIQDPNTIVSNLLSGSAHMTDNLTPQHALALKRQWTPEQAGTILLNPTQLRFTQVQMRPEVATPRGLLDVRVRRAVAHTIDKQAINDVRFEGEGLTAETLISPTADYYGEIDRAIAKYPYDIRRAEQLMREAGFTRSADGFYASPTEGRFAFDAWQAYPLAEDQELSLMADLWRRSGMDARPYVLPPAQLRDGQLKATFPGLMTTGGGIGERALRALGTAAIPTAENRWSGGINFGGWSNPEYDQLLGDFLSTLDRGERNRQIVQMMKIVSEQVPWILLYVTGFIVAHGSVVEGPQVTALTSATAWNVHEWVLR